MVNDKEKERLIRDMLTRQASHEERLLALENHRKRQEKQMKDLSVKMDRLINLVMASLFTFIGGLVILIVQNLGG